MFFNSIYFTMLLHTFMIFMTYRSTCQKVRLGWMDDVTVEAMEKMVRSGEPWCIYNGMSWNGIYNGMSPVFFRPPSVL